MFFRIVVFFILAGILTGLVGYLLGYVIYAESKTVRITGKMLGLAYSVLLLFHIVTIAIWGDIEYLAHRLSELDFGLSYILALLFPIVGYTILTVGWLTPPILGFYLGVKRKRKRTADKITPTKTQKD